MSAFPNLISPAQLPIEQIVDDYVQRARSSLRPTEYEREQEGDITLHRVTENDQFRVLDHIIAVRDNTVAWIWRNQDFWPTDTLTDITLVGDDLLTVGVIHGGSTVQGVKIAVAPKSGAASDPDNCLPYVSNFNHVEAHYRLDDHGKQRLERARMGVDFLTKDGKTLLARAVRNPEAASRNGKYRYRSSLGQRLLVRVTGAHNLSINLPTTLTDDEVEAIRQQVALHHFEGIRSLSPSIFVINRD